MRMPRVRFSIGGLMVAVLVAGVALWGVGALLLPPTVAERQAQASYRQAKLIREVAEYALKEYKEGIYLQDKATYLGQIKLAESDRERAIDRLEWSAKMHAKGFVPIATNISDKLSKEQADFDLEQARTQLEVLEKYTKEKQIKSLRSDIEKARADEQSKLANWRMEQARKWRIPGF